MTGRILIYDGIASNRIALRSKLAAACYDVVQAATPAQVRLCIREERPDLVVLDLDGDTAETLALCKTLTSQADTAGIPVLTLSDSVSTDLNLDALRNGAADLLTKPVQEELFLARLRRLLRQRSSAAELESRDLTNRQLGLAEQAAGYVLRGKVALVTPDAATGAGWKTALQPLLGDRLSVMSRDEALALYERKDQPDIFVIASTLTRPGDGTRLLSELRSGASTRYSGVIMVLEDPVQSTEERSDTAAMALDLGANDVLTCGFRAQELALRITAQMQHKRRGDELRRNLRAGLEMAVRDPLTGLYNRRYAVPHLQSVASSAQSRNCPFAVMMLDLDRFKSINDTYGHSVGDRVLVEIARRLRANMRSEDLIARIGGEEFLVVMPDTDLDQARVAAHRMCALVRDTPVSLPYDAGHIQVTVSIGLAMGRPDTDDASLVERIMHEADLALYEAKAEGRDQFNVSRPAA